MITSDIYKERPPSREKLILDASNLIFRLMEAVTEPSDDRLFGIILNSSSVLISFLAHKADAKAAYLSCEYDNQWVTIYGILDRDTYICLCNPLTDCSNENQNISISHYGSISSDFRRRSPAEEGR